MALSGNVSTGEIEGRTVVFSWNATQNASNNTSTVTWQIKGGGSDRTYGVRVREV